MSERLLTWRELNRALLARQLLLERGALSIPKALERIGGIQAQYAPSMYIGLWSRLDGLERNALTRALERRAVVQATMMRATIHLVSRADYWPLTAGIRDERRAWWERVHKQADPKRARATAKKLRAMLAGRPRRWKEIQERFGRTEALAAAQYVDLVRVPPSGTWEQRRADLYGLAEEWVGPDEADPDLGLELLLRRYLAAFGPATAADAADFGMVSIGRVRAVLGRMQLRRYRDEDGRELVDLPRAPLPPAETPVPPRFLPVWDATLLVHARRTRILPEEHRSKVFNTKTPNSVNTFLLDGQVAGTWRHENGRVEIEPFASIPRAARKELDEEAERLAAFHS
ncbi:MAG TPA: winged helix DNA-binding domain-containing protein [Gaiellaceae bacterium]|nr:winged helix DNA-binding domain-containing protein [Gaiellaceae bacterium]